MIATVSQIITTSTSGKEQTNAILPPDGCLGAAITLTALAHHHSRF
jgi:hypothetical protein